MWAVVRAGSQESRENASLDEATFAQLLFGLRLGLGRTLRPWREVEARETRLPSANGSLAAGQALSRIPRPLPLSRLVVFLTTERLKCLRIFPMGFFLPRPPLYFISGGLKAQRI